MVTSGITRNILQFFLDGLPVPLFAVDAELRYVVCNRAHADAVQACCGARPHRGVPLPEALAAVPDLDRLVGNLRRVLGGERVFDPGLPAALGAGSRDIEVAYVPLRGDDGTVIGVAVAGHDVTDLRRALEAERRLRQSEEHLRQRQKLEALGTLAGGLAHEINNPVNVILNYAELIVEDAPEGPLRDHGRKVIHEVERVASIVRDLLNFARPAKSGLAPAEVADVVAEAVLLVEASLRKSDVHLEVQVAPDLPTFPCRSQQVQQVLVNLLTNARDAVDLRWPGAASEKRVTLRASRAWRDGREHVRFEVDDTGPGIPPDIAPRIFEPFFSTKPRDRGTGLGLAISYGIVREYGGAIAFEDAPGGGTRFSVDLPVLRNDEEALSWPES